MSNKRAKEVAKKALDLLHGHDGTVNLQHYLWHLPEFQDADLSLVVKQLNGDIIALKKERDEYKKQLENLKIQLGHSLKPQPVGVTKEQIYSILKSFGECRLDMEQLSEKLAASLSPKWIKCVERMPEIGDEIYWIDKQTTIPCADVYNCEMFDPDDLWQPRYVPAPPKEEGSELVKALKAIQRPTDRSSFDRAMQEVLEIVKKHDSLGKGK